MLLINNSSISKLQRFSVKSLAALQGSGTSLRHWFTLLLFPMEGVGEIWAYYDGN